MKDIANRKAKLLEKLEQMNTRLEKIEGALDDPMPKDFEEAAVERESDEVLEEVGHSAQLEKAQILAALERIKDDEYGFCTVCGIEIVEARLDLLPYTPTCAKCAK